MSIAMHDTKSYKDTNMFLFPSHALSMHMYAESQIRHSIFNQFRSPSEVGGWHELHTQHTFFISDTVNILYTK